MYNSIVVGAGYAGAIFARKLAEELNKKVLLIDKRSHIAGNMYDYYSKEGILVHKYGPHISVMNNDIVYQFLSNYTEWIPYEHRVNAYIDGREVPLPINFTSIDILFDKDKADKYKELLLNQYGQEGFVPILTLCQNHNPDLKELGSYIFEKVFLHYTTKMWGLSPNEIDPAVTGRIPIRLSYDDRHFTHKYQVMPKHGFTKLFENMLSHPNISIELNTNVHDILTLDKQKNKFIYNSKIFDGDIIYTGALDELFNYVYGILPYRSLKFVFETHDTNYIQNTSVLNWPDERPATRRTEMKRLTQQVVDGKTTTITEYPGNYDRSSIDFNEPYYPILTTECEQIYEKYKVLADKIPNLYTVGRLADYKYYNMEMTVIRALEYFDSIFNKGA